VSSVTLRQSKELVLQPITICRSEKEKCLIESSVNSIRISICIKQADELEVRCTAVFFLNVYLSGRLRTSVHVMILQKAWEVPNIVDSFGICIHDLVDVGCSGVGHSYSVALFFEHDAKRLANEI
jgi:hypothetical protein